MSQGCIERMTIMKYFKRQALMVSILLLITACAPKGVQEVVTPPVVEEPSIEEAIDEAVVDGIDTTMPEVDWQAITSTEHTISRETPYASGIRVISSTDNGLVNGDFLEGQMPWQINTVDGVVFDQGLLIQGQGAVMQQVILAQGVQGFEKMKTYNVKVEATVSGEIPLTIKIKDISDGRLYASGEMVLVEDETSYVSEITINNELISGAVFEMAIHTEKNDVVRITNVSLTRKEGTLVWSDEFDVDGHPDSSKWAYDVGGNGWGNAERQYYTANDLDNAFVKEGILSIQGLVEETGTNPYTSARMVTRGTYETKFKRIEVRAKLPVGVGTWPAIWMLPANRVYGSWPASGEIDIMEHVGYDPDIIHGTIHTSNYNHTKNTQKSGLLYTPNSGSEFHTYTVDWTPYEIDYYIDDYLYFTYDNDGSGPGAWPFDQDFYLILCLAVGGGWGGIYGIDDGAYPTSMDVDYVRVYEVPLESVDIEVPSNVTEIDVAVNGTLATIYWAPAMDDYIVDHYDIYLDDQLMDSVEVFDYSFYGLAASSNYSVGVIAVDEAGNMSELRTVGFMTETLQSQAIEAPIEGESAIISVGGMIKETETNTYVEYLDQGDYLVFDIEVPKTGKYKVSMAYSSLMGKGGLSIAVDGETVIDYVELGANGSWNDFETAVIGQLDLDQGHHFITIFTEKTGFTVDYLTFE